MEGGAEPNCADEDLQRVASGLSETAAAADKASEKSFYDNASEKFSHSRRSEFEVVPLDDDGNVAGAAAGVGHWAGSGRKPGDDKGADRGKEQNAAKEEKKKKAGAGRERLEAVPVLQMFAYADGLDYFLMFFGAVAAVGVGAAQPGIALLLGSLINAFGLNGDNAIAVQDEVNKVGL